MRIDVFRKLLATASLIATFGLLQAAHAGEWKFVEEKDPITDKTKQYVFGVPAAVDGINNNPYLRIGCYEPGDGMGVTLAWGTPVSPLYPDGQIEMAAVTVRFDSKDPLRLGWSASKTYEFTYPPNAAAGALSQLGESLVGKFLPGRGEIISTWTAKELHHSLLGSDKAIFRASSLRGPDITLAFDMSGYIEEAAKFDSRCNPPGIRDIANPRPSSDAGDARRADLFQRKWTDISEHRAPFQEAGVTDGRYRVSATTKLEAIPVTWRDDTLLVRASDSQWNKPGLFLYFLATEDTTPIWLNGTSPPIRKFIGQGGIKMNPSSVKDYLWTFTFLVRGELGPFLIAENENDTYFPRSAVGEADLAKMKEVAQKLKPFTCKLSDQKAQCDATVFYGNNLFEARFAVSSSGEVEMLGDKPIAANLPASVQAPVN